MNNSINLAIAGTALGVVLGGSGVALFSGGGPAPVVAEAPDYSGLLARVTPECAAELRLVPGAEQGLACGPGETVLGSGEPVKVLICNGAVMPERLRKCVEDARP